MTIGPEPMMRILVRSVLLGTSALLLGQWVRRPGGGGRCVFPPGVVFLDITFHQIFRKENIQGAFILFFRDAS
jgi:hypothetical protein